MYSLLPITYMSYKLSKSRLIKTPLPIYAHSTKSRNKWYGNHYKWIWKLPNTKEADPKIYGRNFYINLIATEKEIYHLLFNIYEIMSELYLDR